MIIDEIKLDRQMFIILLQGGFFFLHHFVCFVRICAFPLSLSLSLPLFISDAVDDNGFILLDEVLLLSLMCFVALSILRYSLSLMCVCVCVPCPS